MPALARHAAAAARVGPLVIGIDEYQTLLLRGARRTAAPPSWTTDGRSRSSCRPPRSRQSKVRSASRSLTGDFVALGTEDGHVSLQQVRFAPRYEEQKLVDLDLAVRDRGYVEIDPQGGPIREVAYDETDGRKTVAGRARGRHAARVADGRRGREHRAELQTRDGERITRVRIGRSDTAVASTEKGNLYHWELAPELRLTEVAPRLRAGADHGARVHRSANITLIVGRRAGEPLRLVPRAAEGGGHRSPLREGPHLPRPGRRRSRPSAPRRATRASSPPATTARWCCGT